MYVSLILKQGVRLLTPGFCDLDLAMAAPGVALEVCGRAGTAPEVWRSPTVQGPIGAQTPLRSTALAALLVRMRYGVCSERTDHRPSEIAAAVALCFAGAANSLYSANWLGPLSVLLL
jgi:hypothetical protein